MVLVTCTGAATGDDAGATVFSTTSPSVNIAAGECAAKQIEQPVSGPVNAVPDEAVLVVDGMATA